MPSATNAGAYVGGGVLSGSGVLQPSGATRLVCCSSPEAMRLSLLEAGGRRYDRVVALERAEPSHEQRDHRREKNESTAYPHQQAADLLVDGGRNPPVPAQDRVEVQRVSRMQVRRIQHGGRKGQPDAEQAVGDRAGEQVALREQRRDAASRQ